MKLTPLAFLTSVERSLMEALKVAPGTDARWSFSRFVNFESQSGSLQILHRGLNEAPQVQGVIHARVSGGPEASSVQGWVQFQGLEDRPVFVMQAGEAAKMAEEIRALVESWSATLSRDGQNSPAEPLPPEAEPAKAPPKKPSTTAVSATATKPRKK